MSREIPLDVPMSRAPLLNRRLEAIGGRPRDVRHAKIIIRDKIVNRRIRTLICHYREKP